MWECLACGAEFYRGEDGEMALCGFHDIDDNEEEEDDDVGIPVGCRACGGDYPNCKDSCPMFD